MARLPLVDIGEMPEALRDAIARGRATGMLSTPVPVQVWAHRPEAAQAWLALLDAFHNRGVLDARLRELVRLRIAVFTQCQACNLARKSDTVNADDLAELACQAAESEHFDARERAALRYAELFAVDHQSIGEAEFAELARHFTTAETVELQMFCAMMLAGGRMTLVQQAYEERST